MKRPAFFCAGLPVHTKRASALTLVMPTLSFAGKLGTRCAVLPVPVMVPPAPMAVPNPGEVPAPVTRPNPRRIAPAPIAVPPPPVMPAPVAGHMPAMMHGGRRLGRLGRSGRRFAPGRGPGRGRRGRRGSGRGSRTRAAAAGLLRGGRTGHQCRHKDCGGEFSQHIILLVGSSGRE